jgi:hypothetical protein
MTRNGHPCCDPWEITPVHSRNVVARIDGAAPKLKDEYVVFSAHLEHVGIVAAVPGDLARQVALRYRRGHFGNVSHCEVRFDAIALTESVKSFQRLTLSEH